MSRNWTHKFDSWLQKVGKGHSLTTSTRFWSFLTTYLPLRGHFLLWAWTKIGIFWPLSLPTSSCPRSFCTTPNIILNVSTFSVEGCWGQPILLFWKLIHKTQMSNPPGAASYYNSIKLLILLPLRAIYFYSLYYETPCTYLCTYL